MDKVDIIKIYEDSPQRLILTKEQQKDILSMKSIIGENNVDLQIDGKLMIRHYVGFIQVDKTRLLIYPKIASKGNDELTYNKAFEILIKLLSYSGFNSIKRIPNPQQIGKYKGDLLELFIGIFVDELLLRFRRDVNRSYNYTMENQSFIKGKIDFSETVKKNSYRKHLHYVKFDQFTEDILLNRILKTIIGNLIKKTRVQENKKKLHQALLLLEDVETIKLHNGIWDQVKFTRLNITYEPVYNMAKLFYYNSGPNLNKGEELTFSFLVPLNQLFERYVFELLKNSISGDKYIKYQGPIDYLGSIKGKGYLQLRPDISIMKDKEVITILDAKYKEVIDSSGNITVSQADIYQMLAYSVRYQCNDIMLVYPKFLNQEESMVLISQIDIENYGYRIGIKLIQVDLENEASVVAGKLNECLGFKEK